MMSKLLKSEWLPVTIDGYIVLLDTHINRNQDTNINKLVMNISSTIVNLYCPAIKQ